MTTNDTKEKERLNFLGAQKKAEGIAKDPKKISRLIEASKEKMGKLEVDSEKVSGVIEQVKLFLRMLKAYVKGEYKVIPWKTVLLIVAGLIYFVSPLDLIPDLIPITGFIDDFSILLWIFNRLQKDIDAFQLWEQNPTSQPNN